MRNVLQYSLKNKFIKVLFAVVLCASFNVLHCMQIIIKTIGGQIIVIKVEPTDTVTIVKQKINDVAGIPSYQQRLMVGGKILEDSKTLNEYNIGEKSVIFLS